MKKTFVIAMGLAAAVSAFGQAKENFVMQQAYAEMQRVNGQMEVLETNVSDLQRRVGALEGGNDSRGIRQEIDSLRAAIDQLRRDMQAMRGEVVKDLSGRLAKMQQPAPAPKPVETRVVIGPHREYTVQPGDTLSLIAQAFDTTVAKIKQMNNLKNDNLRVGQKLNVPK